MNGLTIAGIVLIIAGVLAFAFPRLSFTDQETVLEVGPVSVEATERRTVTIPDIAAGIAVAAGVVMVVAGARSENSA